MRKKELRLIVTFATAGNAMAVERVMKINNIQGRLIPIPDEISAGCGLAYSAPVESRAEIISVLNIYQLEREKIVEIWCY